MAQAQSIQASPAATQFAESLKTTQHNRLLVQFTRLLTEVNDKLEKLDKKRGKVEILGNEFQIKPQASARDNARGMAGTRDAYYVSRRAEGPTQLVLTNTKTGPELQEIKITIPTTGNSAGKVSLIVVTNKEGLTTSFEPSSNTFIQRDSLRSDRTRITAEEVKKE